MEFYTATNQGNGAAILWNVDTKKVEYTFENQVDYHRELYVSDEILEKYNLSEGTEEDNYKYSFIYQGDMLNSYYYDVNEDGYDDAVFCGVKCLMHDFDELPLASSYIEEVYLYDVDKNEFIYSEEFGYEQELK